MDTIAPRNDEHTLSSPRQADIEKSYAEIIQRGKEQEPGINELLELYGQFQRVFKQSQDYLRLTQGVVSASTSTTSSPLT
jgi:hypothetical protein